MEIDRDSLWEHLRYLCEEIGPRLSGTAADEEAVTYIASHMRHCGAEVEVQDYPCPGWDYEETELTLLGDGGQESLPAVAQTFTNGCDVEAELAVVGTRHELEFRPDLEGKILVLHGEAGSNLAMNRNVGLQAIEERRPAAAIIATSAEHVSSKLIRDPFLQVPAAAVAEPVSRRLMEQEGARARLRIRARRYDSTGHNVIGRLPGAEEGRIVVGAHYDTAALTPGAADDASGTAVVLELCEVFAAAAERQLGIDFIAFGAEEYGRHLRALGSVEYVRRHPEQTRATRAMIQVDGVGTAGCTPQVHVMGWPEERKKEVLRVLEQFPRYRVDEKQIMSSDHAPFLLNGVPALAFMNSGSGVPIHTPADSMELMDRDELAFTAQVAAAVVRHLAGVSKPA